MSLVVRAQQPGLGSDLAVAQGMLHGASRDARGVLAFKGIPYAAPPVGELRWRAPQPTAAWSGPKDVTHYGARCWQMLNIPGRPGAPQSEDCLTLNVWTAAMNATERRPVMVWIHGGGFEFGSSGEPNTDGTNFAAKGVVLVSLNYRLGIFGFLAHPGLDREGPSGDYGLQDQIAALKWVKANIASFGGDPGNITLFGESAGAHAVGILMASPLSKGLFQKAIGESGAFWDSEHGSLSTFEEAHARGVRFAQKMGASSIEELRALAPEALISGAGWTFATDPGTTAFSPSIDRFVVTDAPSARFRRGEQMHVPLLTGWNEREDAPFDVRALPHRTAQEFREAAAKVFGASRLHQFLALYPANTDEEARASAEALVGDMVIAEQTWEWLNLQRMTGRVQTYGYTFTYTSAFLLIAAHASEVTFVFGTLVSSGPGERRVPTDADRMLSDQMTTYWVNFATSGDPNGSGLPAWPKFDGETVEDFGRIVGPTTPGQIQRFRFLASYRSQSGLPATWRELPTAETTTSPTQPEAQRSGTHKPLSR